jgi:hypothetical protein
MADFVDPSAVMATNPYLSMTQAPDWRGVLHNARLGRETTMHHERMPKKAALTCEARMEGM